MWDRVCWWKIEQSGFTTHFASLFFMQNHLYLCQISRPLRLHEVFLPRRLYYINTNVYIYKYVLYFTYHYLSHRASPGGFWVSHLWGSGVSMPGSAWPALVSSWARQTTIGHRVKWEPNDQHPILGAPTVPSLQLHRHHSGAEHASKRAHLDIRRRKASRISRLPSLEVQVSSVGSPVARQVC